MLSQMKIKPLIQAWPIYPLIRYSLLLLGLLSLSRLALSLWLFDRVGSIDHLLTIMLYGLRFDIIVACLFWLIPALLLLFLPATPRLAKWLVNLCLAWFTLSSIFILFMELSTPAFIDQYDTRPNRIYFEYLETPLVIIRTSVLEYPWHFLAAMALLAMLVAYLLKFNRRIIADIKPWPVLLRVLLLPLFLFIFVVGARSSFDHRPANASTAAFSNDQLVNKLGLSSAYTVLTAAYNLRHENSSSSEYGEMPDQQIVRLVREHSFIDASDFVPDETSTWHRQTVAKADNPFNLVIILQESLGAGFSAKLGGVGVTPEIDSLADEGLWFTRLYSTGTRSARGLEAIITGFPPSPSRSVLKLGLAQQRFSTLASILKQNNYNTHFLYGGESHFDNMAGFFLANGFDRVTNDKDYADPKFRGTWGVSDEDLLNRLDEELLRDQASAKFILAFSSSNHSPFEFPDNTISLHDNDKHTVNNAVKYADYAVGQFFDKARTQPYWDNTFFLIVSDHDTRVVGASLVPINKFHIPGLLIGPGVEPAVYDKVASQIDLAPTLLDYLGISSSHPMIGHNLRRIPDSFPGRALMQYGNNHAYRLGDRIIVQMPQKEPRQFDYIDRELVETTLDPVLGDIARSHLLWPMYAYREQKYLIE
ncbi:MAG: phosphoglycerol transferase MdoB-like AlkP superfamily enzyme [Planctomycetota bacterium]|jgi:phosphoglycerol transferase MdoB-like AlkP superfamily enzyme